MKSLQVGGDLGEERRVVEVLGPDAGEALDEVGQGADRLDRRVEGVDLALRRELDRADFDDLAGFGAEAGGLQVEGDVGGHGCPWGKTHLILAVGTAEAVGARSPRAG